jgi:membrane-associated phospholipid phosphatase
MRLAKLISLLLHPIVMPLIGLVIIFHSGVYSIDIPIEYKRFVYMVVILCNVLLPLSIIPGLMYFKHIQNYTMDARRERLIPLFFTTICYYIGYYFVAKFASVRLINIFLFSSTLVILVVLSVSLFWKISIHMAGIGGLIGMILGISLVYGIDATIILSICILAGGLIAASRLILHTHTIIQLIAGFFVGACVVFGFVLQLIL